VPAALLPPVRPADAVAGELPLAGADVPVVVGGADTALALLAAGEGGAQLNLGTGAQLLAPGWTPAAVPEPAAQHHAGVLDGWYAQVGLRTGASAWSWAREALGLDWPGFWAAAAGAAPGAGGVRFTPFLTGEPALGDRPAGWTGVTTATGRAELARAAVEGVAFAVAAAADLLALPEGPLTLTGGGGRSELVAQLLADALGRPVRRVAVRSASATGAAALAARGAGLDLAVRRDAASPVDPGPDAAVLADAAAAWRAGLRVERDRGGHR
jgi:xylulokinase